MKLTQEQVKHIAKLARLKLTEAEVEMYSEQLSKVIGYIDILNEVDTKEVAPTFQVTGLTSVTRKDEMKKDFAEREELLKCTNLPVERGQIKVRRVLQ